MLLNITCRMCSARLLVVSPLIVVVVVVVALRGSGLLGNGCSQLANDELIQYLVISEQEKSISRLQTHEECFNEANPSCLQSALAQCFLCSVETLQLIYEHYITNGSLIT